jgi:hypothetical protein
VIGYFTWRHVAKDNDVSFRKVRVPPNRYHAGSRAVPRDRALADYAQLSTSAVRDRDFL